MSLTHPVILFACALGGLCLQPVVVAAQGEDPQAESRALSAEAERLSIVLRGTETAKINVQKTADFVARARADLKAVYEDATLKKNQLEQAETTQSAEAAADDLLSWLGDAKKSAKKVAAALPAARQWVQFTKNDDVELSVQALEAVLLSHLIELETQAEELVTYSESLEVKALATRNLAVSVRTGKSPPASSKVLIEQKRQWRAMLEDRVRWLEDVAHAPLLATRVRASLAAMDAGGLLVKPRRRREASIALAEGAAERRASAAEDYLSKSFTMDATSCRGLAIELLDPEHTAAHEQRFIDFLRCIEQQRQP